jgi:hypothetical protein
MKRIIQLTSIMFLLAGLTAQATVNFTLANKSESPITINCNVDDEAITLNFNTLRLLADMKRIDPDEIFSLDIENGKFELVIDNRKTNYRYETLPSANNKDKILVWDGSQLLPASEKHRLMGLIKTKTTIKNNVSIGELVQTEGVQFK